MEFYLEKDFVSRVAKEAKTLLVCLFLEFSEKLGT